METTNRPSYELLLSSIGEGVVAVDTSGRITLVNEAAVAKLGYGGPDELVGRDAHALVHHSHRDGSRYPASECTITRAYGTHASGGDEVFWRKDGSSFEIEYTTTPVLADGAVVGTVVVFRDVTRARELQDQLRHAQKMDAIGRLAGGVAHDFNNLLTAIFGYSDLALARLDGHPAAREVGQLREVAVRARDLTAQLLTLARRQALSPRAISANDLVEEALPLLRRLIGEDVRIRTVLEVGLGDCVVDPGSLHQAIVNLCVNARDAMPSGGTIEIWTRSSHVDPHRAADVGVEPGDYVLLGVADTGCGMDAATLDRIFEPFFTTKPPGAGTGLGLATVYGMLEQSGGGVDVRSAPGSGTVFTLYLPADTRERDAGRAPADGRAYGIRGDQKSDRPPARSASAAAAPRNAQVISTRPGLRPRCEPRSA